MAARELALLEKAWQEVVEEESAKDPLFRRVAEGYSGFREQYTIWGEAQALKPMYLE